MTEYRAKPKEKKGKPDKPTNAPRGTGPSYRMIRKRLVNLDTSAPCVRILRSRRTRGWTLPRPFFEQSYLLRCRRFRRARLGSPSHRDPMHQTVSAGHVTWSKGPTLDSHSSHRPSVSGARVVTTEIFTGLIFPPVVPLVSADSALSLDEFR